VKRLFPYLKFLRPHKLQIFLAIFCGLVAGLATGVGIPLLFKVIFPPVFGSTDHDLSNGALFFLCSLPFLLFAVRGVAGFGQQYFTGFCGQKILERLRVMIFDKLQHLQLAYFHNHPPGDLISRAMADSTSLQASLMEFAVNGVRQPFTLIGAICVIVAMCLRSHHLAFLAIFILLIPAVAIPIRRLGRRLRGKAGLLQRDIGALTQRLSQNLAGTKEIRSFCLEDTELARFDQAARETSRSFLKVTKYFIIVSPVIEVIAALGIGAALFYAYKTRIPWQDVVTLGVTFYLCYDPVKRLGDLNSKIQQGLAALDRIEALLGEPVTINDPPNPITVGRLLGRIVFENVAFAYADETVLHDVSLTLEPGETYAIVGPSGAGKTTFVNLLPRFFDATSGRLTIDGHDVRDCRLADLRRNIGFVSQDPVIFSDTVFQNIVIGKIGASRDEVIAAARKAHAHEFIQELEKGYDTVLGTSGSGLSGGQKQRVAIARAFLKDAPILILDEATSALDSQSERMIQLALEELMAGRTVLIVAHRFSSIKHARHILVFERGEIVEQGSHEELSRRGGVYAGLYDAQGR
jgi:subfamily B ATP-binding cassette protein MsbA